MMTMRIFLEHLDDELYVDILLTSQDIERILDQEFLSSDETYTTETDVHIGIRLDNQEEEDAISEE